MECLIKQYRIFKQISSQFFNKTALYNIILFINQLTIQKRHYGIFEIINSIIVEHNKKTNEFQTSIKQAQKSVELHLVSLYADDFSNFEKQISDKEIEIKVQEKEFQDLEKQISILEQEVRNSQIPADEINRDITFIMGRSELVFTNTKFGYRITRNGKRAEHLSKGEENAIALIYFFNALQDVEVTAADTIVVLDDPISSFDSNFYYNAISYIRDKTLHIGQTFIFTHKFALLKDFSKLMLVSENKQYSPISVESFENYHFLGEVIKIISQDHIPT